MSAAVEQLRLGAEPRVDLMPAEVREKRKGRGLRRALVFALVVALVTVGAGFALASIRAATASAELQQAQARTSELLAQQLEYAEVTQLETLRDRIVADRAFVTAHEVFWKEALTPLLRVLPEGAAIVSVNTRTPAFDEATLDPVGPLRKPRVAEVNVVVFTPGIPEATAWLRALENTPAFADAIPSAVALQEGGYATTLALNLDERALAGRFDQTETTDAEGEENE